MLFRSDMQSGAYYVKSPETQLGRRTDDRRQTTKGGMKTGGQTTAGTTRARTPINIRTFSYFRETALLIFLTCPNALGKIYFTPRCACFSPSRRVCGDCVNDSYLACYIGPKYYPQQTRKPSADYAPSPTEIAPFRGILPSYFHRVI